MRLVLCFSGGGRCKERWWSYGGSELGIVWVMVVEVMVVIVCSIFEGSWIRGCEGRRWYEFVVNVECVIFN